MDEKVLAAQRWVNSTYSGIAGYEPCAEDGTTGWQTMYALTMGLQHELGISPVVPSFGPTTVSKLQDLGTINQDSKSSRIIQIVKHALFCKGYWGGDHDNGEWEEKTSLSVIQIRSDMGIDGIGNISPKVFRCLLNMDAYIRVTGGTEKVRDIQRWLNYTYADQSAYTIGPCDGIYSRDVQKSLLIGIQYELGVSGPNGNFGPGTQSALRAASEDSKRLKVGSTGILVSLFSAACVFNEGFLIDGVPVTTSFKSTYDSGLASFVSFFQDFSELYDLWNGAEGELAEKMRGQADYRTWAQLLVSMGDPTRPARGCDTRFEITEFRARHLNAAGYSCVGRYIYDPPGSTLDKEIKEGELSAIFDSGMRVFPIFQANGRLLGDFSYSTGLNHGSLAHSRAEHYGFNRGTVIYFAVDYDATQVEIDAAIVPYFQGVSLALRRAGGKYIHGVYGSRNVCANVTAKTFARFSFVSGMSWGFSGNLGFPLPNNWSFNQIQEVSFDFPDSTDVIDLDRDVARKSGGDRGQGAVDEESPSLSRFLDRIRDLRLCAEEYGEGDPDRLVMKYFRRDKYDDVAFTLVCGEMDYAFLDYADQRGFTLDSMREFVDPFSGYTIGSEHLMATMEGHLNFAQPTSEIVANLGDIGGWAGDLCTFYADWRKALDSYPNAADFAGDYLAVPGAVSTFGFTDLIEDTDGYNIAKQVRSGDWISGAMLSYYQDGEGSKRFGDYFEGRFSSLHERASDIAFAMLRGNYDPAVATARNLLIAKFGVLQPEQVDSEDVRALADGFADALAQRSAGEARTPR